MTQLYLQKYGIGPFTLIIGRLLFNWTNILLCGWCINMCISKYLSIRNFSDCHQRLRQSLLRVKTPGDHSNQCEGNWSNRLIDRKNHFLCSWIWIPLGCQNCIRKWKISLTFSVKENASAFLFVWCAEIGTFLSDLQGLRIAKKGVNKIVPRFSFILLCPDP